MKVFTRIRDLRNHLKKARINNQSIGLVPTMGALHSGHQALMEKCTEENDLSLCSIFVNPKQFNNKKDLEKYPRTLKEDLKNLESWNCDMVFAPSEEEMYPDSKSWLTLNFGPAENILEGEFRPGHFAGVGTVVSKLFNVCNPDRAYFGLKDIQQCFIIERLVKELAFQVKLRFLNTVREKNGLAVSSRNKRLNADELEVAAHLFGVLKEVKLKLMQTGGSVREVITRAKKSLNKHKIIQLEYLEAVNLRNFTKVSSVLPETKIAICIAAYVGGVRLIDNIIFKFQSE